MLADGWSQQRSNYWLRLTCPLADQVLPHGVSREFRRVDLFARNKERNAGRSTARAHTVREDLDFFCTE